MRRSIRLLFLLLALIGVAGTQSNPIRERKTGTGVFRGMPVDFEVVNGMAVMGCIILGSVEEIENGVLDSEFAKPGGPKTAVVRPDLKYRWPDGIIPYTIDPEIPNQARITEAVQHWNEKTSIKMVPRSGEVNYLHFQRQNNNGVCYSSLGMVGGKQIIAVDDLCSRGTMIHEIGHTVGFWHEQSRNDRDAHIEVLYDNIQAGYASQYNRALASGIDIGPYDYGSIMHYGTGSFSKNGQPTMATLPMGIPIGQRTGLSVGDIDATERMYAAAPARTTIATNPDGMEVVVDGVTYKAPQTFDWAPGSAHTLEAKSSDGASLRWTFGRWSNDGEQRQTIVASADTTVYLASYVREVRFTARANSAAGGTVSLSPPSPTGFYALGGPVTVSATPNPGYYFAGWTVPGGRETHGLGLNPAVVSAAALEYVANFTTDRQTTVTSDPPGITVTVNGHAVITPQNFGWSEGSTHSISAPATFTPRGSTTERYEFAAWSSGTAREQTVTASSTVSTYTASYKGKYLVTLATTPRGGEIQVVPSSPDGFYDEGAAVTLHAQPATNYKFSGWAGAVSGTANPTDLIVAKDQTVTANFGIPGQFSNGIVSAASYVRGPVAPGLLVSIFGVEIGPETAEGLRLKPDGTVDTTLGGVRVLFDGVPGPLTYVSANQINVVTPYSVSGKSQTAIGIERNGQPGSAVNVAVANVKPGLFMLGGTGRGAILNQDGTVNSPDNPAAPGSIIVLYGTGAGQTDPPGVDGKPAWLPFPKPLLPVKVRIGGRPAEVHYAGAAPELVAGVLQVNVKIPPNTLPGDSIPVLLQVGDVYADAAVTVAVR